MQDSLLLVLWTQTHVNTEMCTCMYMSTHAETQACIHPDTQRLMAGNPGQLWMEDVAWKGLYGQQSVLTRTNGQEAWRLQAADRSPAVCMCTRLASAPKAPGPATPPPTPLGFRASSHGKKDKFAPDTLNPSISLGKFLAMAVENSYEAATMH